MTRVIKHKGWGDVGEMIQLQLDRDIKINVCNRHWRQNVDK